MNGAGKHPHDGVTLGVTRLVMTVADCFQYRIETGVDVALEANRGQNLEIKLRSTTLRATKKIC